MSALEASSLGRRVIFIGPWQVDTTVVSAIEKGVQMHVWCGVDWAEHHHDVAFVDDDGKLLVKQRITDDAGGFAQLHELLTAHAAMSSTPIAVAIETSRGLMPSAIMAAGFTVYAINPLSVSRYRDRHSPSRAKSDAADALVQANILRTDLANHRPVPADSELVQALRVLARAQQDAVWDRQQIANKLRSLLREFYPTFLVCSRNSASVKSSSSNLAMSGIVYDRSDNRSARSRSSRSSARRSHSRRCPVTGRPTRRPRSTPHRATGARTVGATGSA